MAVEKGIECNREHGRNIMLAMVGKKGMAWDEATSNSPKIKHIAQAVIELTLSEGITT